MEGKEEEIVSVYLNFSSCPYFWLFIHIPTKACFRCVVGVLCYSKRRAEDAESSSTKPGVWKSVLWMICIYLLPHLTFEAISVFLNSSLPNCRNFCSFMAILLWLMDSTVVSYVFNIKVLVGICVLTVDCIVWAYTSVCRRKSWKPPRHNGTQGTLSWRKSLRIKSMRWGYPQHCDLWKRCFSAHKWDISTLLT